MPLLTIDFTPQQVQRMQPAIEEAMRRRVALYQGPATIEDAQTIVKAYLQSLVRNYEHRQNVNALQPPDPFEPT
jgi:hypothetical protein